MSSSPRISTRAHGTTDFLVALVLVFLPSILGFGPTRAGWTALAVGILVLANALLTDFEAGRIRRIGIPVHLWADGLLGFFLAVSPWLLEFDRTAWIPHVAVGAALIVIALLTRTVPGYDRRRTGSAPADA